MILIQRYQSSSKQAPHTITTEFQWNVNSNLFDYSDVDIEAQFSINQSRADEITMREDYSNYHMPMNDDGFGDLGFDGSDFIRDGGVDVRIIHAKWRCESC